MKYLKTRLILLFRIFIRLIANTSKALSYVFHLVLPKKRFSLPSHSPAWIKSKRESKVPKTIWQTNFTQNVTLPVYLNYLFNRLMAPDYDYRFMVTQDREIFIKENFSEDIHKAYSKLQIGASQADFWRILVLYKLGGVYMDIDAHLIRPLGVVINEHQHEIYLKIKTGEISNYFIASAPANPLLEKIIKQIIKNIEENSIKNVYDLTGPGVFNTVIDINSVETAYYRETCNQGSFTNEYFQYIDKPQGKWTKEQQKVELVKSADD